MKHPAPTCILKKNNTPDSFSVKSDEIPTISNLKHYISQQSHMTIAHDSPVSGCSESAERTLKTIQGHSPDSP